MKKIFLILSLILAAFGAKAQKIIDYSNPKEYTIANITVSGIKFLSNDALITLSGLDVGEKINVPGDDISHAIKKLWDQGLFSDVKISIVNIKNDSVYLNIYLKEQPRLNNIYFYGINKSQESDLRDKLGLKTGQQVTDNLIRNTKNIIKNYYADKGFPNVETNFKIVDDTVYQNTVNLYISINKKNKVKIKKITIRGNNYFSDKKIKRFMKETKQKAFYRFWKPSKFVEAKFNDDKKAIIQKYNDAGYRDAKIIEDSVYQINDKELAIYLKIYEGKRYYIRNIDWFGNTKYSSEYLSKILDIKKGDPYNQSKLEKRLQTDDDGISTLYMDNGYLFFQVVPQEADIVGDSVDLRILILEGPQATINHVKILGNDRTNDYVVRRELRTYPGELFSKTDIIRSVREIANLGSFDPEQIKPQPIPDQANSTVDLNYNLVERPNDVFELSGGWSAYGFTGQIAIKFNNFAMKDFFHPKEWDPLPMGDGEKFSISARMTGPAYQFYNISYTKPWFGGKKPNSFSISLYYNRITNASFLQLKPSAYMNIVGGSIGLGRRLSIPDDYFILSNSIGLQRYIMKDYYKYSTYYHSIKNGDYNLLTFTTSLSRNSIDNPLYTRKGSNMSISLKATPPYSLFIKKSWATETDSSKFKWTELYQLKIKGDWYTELVKNLVLRAGFQYGFVGYYNKEIGYSPFEGFSVGGAPMSYYNFGTEIIPLRGYKNNSLTPVNGAHLYDKYTLELRYPILLKEMATLYVLGFLEGGNAWYDLSEFNPFSLYRSAGIGARLYVPMLGLVGIDLAYGFDPLPGNIDVSGWQVHFSFGQNF